MPAPVYVVAAGLTAAAATYAFVRFVYEPHIAPALERLAEDFIERRRAYKREREQRERQRHLAQEISLSARAPSSDGGDGDDGLTRRAGLKRKGTSDSSSTDDNTGDRPAPSSPPRFPNPASGAGASGVAIGLTPDEVNEWRNAVNKTSISLRQRKFRVDSARSGDDAPWNGPSNAKGLSNVREVGLAEQIPSHGVTPAVWTVGMAAQDRLHVLDEPNQRISQTPISPTPATASASKSPFLPTASSITSGSNTTSHAEFQRRTERGGGGGGGGVRQLTRESPILNQHRPYRLSDGLESNRTSMSFPDSAISASSPSTLGLGLKPVFVVGEVDESVRGSAPSTTTQRTVALAEEGEEEALPTPIAAATAGATVEGLVLKLNTQDPSLGLLDPPKTMSSSLDRMTIKAQPLVDPFVSSEPPLSSSSSSNPNPSPNPNPNQTSTEPVLSLSQSYPISLDYEQGIELVSHPSESEPASSEYAFGSELGTPSDRPSSPDTMDGAASPFIQLSPPRLPLLTLPNATFEPGSVPTIRQVMDGAERVRSNFESPHSASSSTMFYSFTEDRQMMTGQNVAQEQRTPDIMSPMLSELEFSSDDGHTSSFASNDDLGSESSWTSARV